MATSYNYYLRKDGKALFQHKRYPDKYCRSSYIPYIKGYTLSKDLKLFVTHSMPSALEMRKRLFEYCGEWYDIYRDGEKII